jgi:capsular exopolysaccharide synthesis family protein
VLTFAEVPLLPSSPNIPMNMLLSLVIGLGAGLLAAFLAETFFKGVTGPEEIETATGEHYLGSIPLLSSVTRGDAKTANAIGEQPRSAFAESFRSLRTSIEQIAFGPAQIIAVTSALPKEGKSVTAICLAQTLARSGERTLLIDCDEASRGVSRQLRLPRDHPGLLQVLEETNSLEETILSGDAGLSILPIRMGEKPGEAILTGDQMDDLLKILRERFEYIVLDLPPVLPIAAARELAAKADATIMLIRWRKTALAALQSALRQMPEDRINVVGVALTQVDMRRRSLFGKNDPSFYFREYRSYYS